MTRYLIVNADDLGCPEGSVEAIAELFELGLVTSTSSMTNKPDWPRAAALLRQHPGWCAGVHLVMNDGQPVLPPERVPTLVDRTGHFRDGWALLARYPLLSQAQLRAEWKAQIERFIADTGRQPSHLDLHCHWPYVFPAWFRLTLDLAQEYGGIPVRMPFDDALEEKAAMLAAGSGFPAWYILRNGRRYRQMVDQRGLARPNFFETRFSQDGNRTAEFLLALLEELPQGVTELLCHPGTQGWRVGDYEALRDPRVRQRINELGIRLTDYRSLSSVIAR